MKIANISLNSLILIICGLLYWETFHFKGTFGSTSAGSAYFPRIVLIIIMITSSIELLKSFSMKKSSGISKIGRKAAFRLTLFVAIIAIYITVLGKIPFVLASSVALFLMGMILELSLIPSIITSIGLSVSVYLIFSAGFNIIL